MIVEAKYFVAGQRSRSNRAAPQTALDEALEYLITNTFTKMGYLKRVYDTPENACRKSRPSYAVTISAKQTLAIQTGREQSAGH